jgi:hypothetical protein
MSLSDGQPDDEGLGPGERARAMITSQVNQRPEGAPAPYFRLADEPDLLATMGALVAYAGNLVQIVAILWDCTPGEAWEAICAGERGALGDNPQ